MQYSPLEHKKRICCEANNFADLAELFIELINDISDIRKPLRPIDSLENREAIRSYLQEALDSMQRIRKNESIKAGLLPAASRPAPGAEDL